MPRSRARTRGSEACWAGAPRAKATSAIKTRIFMSQSGRLSEHRSLEVKAQRQLELAVGARSDLVGHRGGERSEGAPSRALGVRLAGLDDAGGVVQSRCAAARRREYRTVQDVVTLGPEFQVLGFRDRKLLGHGEVELADTGSAQGIACQVAVGARLGNRERRRIDVQRAVADVVRIHS